MARNKELNQKMKVERKGQILSNALILFAVKGLSAVKITDIASAAGMSQGLLYHYYKSKEEIFIELIKSAFEKMSAAALGLERLPLTPGEKIKIAIEKMLQNIEENKDFAWNFLLITQATVSEAIPDEAKQIMRKENLVHYQVIERIIIAGQKDGTIKDYNAEELALVFWTSINGLAINRAVYGKKFRLPDPNILMSIFFKS